MRITHLALVAGAALLVSASAFAASEQVASTDAKSDQLVCRGMVHNGMVVPHVMQCHPRSWWDRERFDAQQAISNMQLKGAMR